MPYAFASEATWHYDGGIPELGIRDVEVVPTSRVADAAQAVIDASGRGVLLSELRPFRRDGGDIVAWREHSR